MKRKYLAFLHEWLSAPDRKPLVIRGARQVGKTWLVRHFAKEQNKQLIELNFEKEPQLASFFQSNDPKQILLNLGSFLDENINPDKCLLFLDEIQAVPEILAKLRWFAEDYRKLPVIAAGSLLEFVLEDHAFSMPVGRIGYMYMEPLSFEEYLMATERETAMNYLETFQWKTEIPKALHEKLMSHFKEYIVIGGMPAAVASWVADHSLSKVNQIHRNLITTYRDDFAKYSGRIDKERLDEVLLAIPKLLGEKFIYSKVNPDVRSAQIKQAFDLLCKARVCHRVTSTHANGIPIGAELDKKFFKAIFLDVGLCSAALGLTFDQVTSIDEIILINSGAVAEQVAGQLLRTINPPYIEPGLYYWLREGKSSAEIDYIIQHSGRLLPIEVKAGSTGSLKSLHLFMDLKKLSIALRINSDLPSQTEVQVKDQDGNEVNYKLLSIPFYLQGQIPRLMGKLL
jgi:predicted AAA+ superfamily ATPase